MQLRPHLLFGVVAALAAAGCVSSPNNNSFVARYDSPVPFVGYATEANAEVRVEALNQRTGQWELVATGRSATTPDIPANPTTSDPDLYGWKITTPLSTASDPNSLCRWNSTCQVPEPSACEFALTASVRVLQGTFQMLTFDQDFGTCIARERADGRTLLQAAINCRSNDSPILHIVYAHIC